MSLSELPDAGGFRIPKSFERRFPLFRGEKSSAIEKERRKEKGRDQASGCAGSFPARFPPFIFYSVASLLVGLKMNCYEKTKNESDLSGTKHQEEEESCGGSKNTALLSLLPSVWRVLLSVTSPVGRAGPRGKRDNFITPSLSPGASVLGGGRSPRPLATFKSGKSTDSHPETIGN